MKVFAAMLLTTSLSGAIAQANQNCSAVTPATCTLAHALGRGINMGNMLEAPREGDWGIRLEPAYINLVAEKFKTVRVPIRWTNHAAPSADATVDEFFADRIDKVVDALLAKGVYVILDMHHYSQLFGDKLHPNEFVVEPQVLEARLINIWRQLAKRYKGKSKNLIFELLNEPHGTLSSADWNQLLAKLVAAVREVEATRTLMIGPTSWNHPKDLAKLQLPADANLIVAIHTYDPYQFTLQGLSWMPQFPKGPTCCSTAQRQVLADSLGVAGNWNKTNGYPLHVGEFGSYIAGDMHSRENYTRMARDLIEAKGIGWTYWEFGSTFGVYDPTKDMWVETIRRALLD